MAICHSSSLLIAATGIGTAVLGFGIKFTLSPSSAVSFFEFDIPTSPSDRKLVESFIVLYAARDIFMGLAIYSAAYFRERRTLGCILITGGGVAVMDGMVIRAQTEKGEWNHWVGATVLATLGSLLLGVLDRV